MKQQRPSQHAHFMVKETAEAMCHELYDHMMQDNIWYQMWKIQNPELDSKALEERFIAKNLSTLLPQARAVLAGMLRSGLDEDLKEKIHAALVLDATLIRGRVN